MLVHLHRGRHESLLCLKKLLLVLVVEVHCMMVLVKMLLMKLLLVKVELLRILRRLLNVDSHLLRPGNLLSRSWRLLWSRSSSGREQTR